MFDRSAEIQILFIFLAVGNREGGIGFFEGSDRNEPAGYRIELGLYSAADGGVNQVEGGDASVGGSREGKRLGVKVKDVESRPRGGESGAGKQGQPGGVPISGSYVVRDSDECIAHAEGAGGGAFAEEVGLSGGVLSARARSRRNRDRQSGYCHSRYQCQFQSRRTCSLYS